MENPAVGIRWRIVAWIPTGIHRFHGNSHKIRSDPSRSGRQIKSPGLCWIILNPLNLLQASFKSFVWMFWVLFLCLLLMVIDTSSFLQIICLNMSSLKHYLIALLNPSLNSSLTDLFSFTVLMNALLLIMERILIIIFFVSSLPP